MHPWLATALGNAAAATVLAALVAAVAPLVRRPAARHGLWLLVLIKLVTPPLGYLPIVPTPPPPAQPPTSATLDAGPTIPEPTTPLDVAPIVLDPSELTAMTTTPEPLPAPPPASPSRPDAATLALAAWLGGALLLWAITLLRLLRLVSALRRAEPAPESERARIAALTAHIGLARVPDLRIIDTHVSPFVAALGRRATVVLPAALWTRLDEPQRDALLLHELAHLRRGDPWVRLVELAATGLYWWLPTLWLARRALHAAEEQACDAWVVATRPAAVRSYADALIETVEFLSRAPALARLAPVPVASSGLGRLAHVTRRITMVMKDRVPPRPSRAGKLTLLGLGLVCLPWLPGVAAPPIAPATALEPGARSTPQDTDADLDELRGQMNIKDAQRRKAHAILQAARARLARLQRIHGSGMVGEEQVEEATLALTMAEADCDIARAEFEVAARRLARAMERRTETDRPPNQPAEPPPDPQPRFKGEESEHPPRIDTHNHQQHATDNLKRIGIALHNYLDQKGSFPPQAIANAKGTPLLSWRVAILPYLDQQALYDRFHLDEPWDSPHNKELLKEMPAVFRSPAMPTPSHEPGLTRVQALVGGTTDHTVINSPDGAKLTDITDGTSNTIVLVEAAGTVPWTRPDDLTPGHEDEEVGKRTHRQGVLALMADGSVRRIPPDLPIHVFHAMLTIDGGEVIDGTQARAELDDATPHIATGRLSFPGPGGSIISIEVPADVAAGSDEERAMRIAAEVARLIAERMQGGVGDDRRPELEAQRAQARIAELEAQLAATRDQIEQARRAEQGARDRAKQQRDRAEERERQAVETVRKFQRNVESEERARLKLVKEHAELIDRLLKLDDDEALILDAFQALLERRPTPEELERGKEIVQRTLKEKPRRAVIETLIRQITSYRDEPARP